MAIAGGAALTTQVGRELSLPDDWLNDSAKGFFVGLSNGELLHESDSLLVRAVSTPQLLAMKLAAWRDAIDRGDARLLLSQMEGSADEVWTTVAPFILRRTRLMIFGSRSMELRDLVDAILAGDLLTARQWVADARRQCVH